MRPRLRGTKSFNAVTCLCWMSLHFTCWFPGPPLAVSNDKSTTWRLREFVGHSPEAGYPSSCFIPDKSLSPRGYHPVTSTTHCRQDYLHHSQFYVQLKYCGSLSIIERMVAVEGNLWYFENAFSSLWVSSWSHSVLRLDEDRVESSSKSSSQSETFIWVVGWVSGSFVVLCSFRTRWFT